MELLRGLASLRTQTTSCVATIGAFDGVHLGHQAVLRQLQEQAVLLGEQTTVITFEPLPREYLARSKAPARIQSFREKCEVLRDFGVSRLLCLRFNEPLRQMTAEAFAQQIFVDGLGVRSLILGDDFRFGRDREGDIEFVRAVGRRAGFETLDTDTWEVDGERVSSTGVRAALDAGDFACAERLLGRPYTISGRVTHGQQLGRQIGVPTANIALRRRTLPVSGVFLARVSGVGLSGAPAIANVGTRPTVNDGQKPNLEVHVLDGEHMLYGHRLTVSFTQKLRDEQRFDSFEALKEQIFTDVDSARQAFAAGQQD